MSISSSTTNSSSNINNTNNEKIKQIKFGVLSQETKNLNAHSLITSYLSHSKIKSSTIKNENTFEFIPEKYANLSIIIYQITDFKKIFELFNWFNAFIILTDIESKNCSEELEKIVDCILDASEREGKKCYVLGFYKDKKNILINEKQIDTLLEVKSVEFEYSEINIDAEEDFVKIMDYIITDGVNIMMENMVFEQNHKLDYDQSQSKCIII